MMSVKKIDSIWTELEEDQQLSTGLLYRRYSSAIRSNVYVALKLPERLRCIAVYLSSEIRLEPRVEDVLRDIKVEMHVDDRRRGGCFMLVILLDNQYTDIFSTLCEDLLYQVADLVDERDLAEQLLQRLESWRLLFERIAKQGLSEIAQRALYGELYFLHSFIKHTGDIDYCVASWKGAQKSIQDFHLGKWAVEVKTTHGKNQQKIYIANERQLDNSIIPSLFLVHYSLEVREGFGQSLNDIVEIIMDMVNNPKTLTSLRMKLLEAGYYNEHRSLYENICYTIRFGNFYRVTDSFPKIVESQIPEEVGDVTYSIVLGDNDRWIVGHDELFQNIASV